jgi:hypothetical protein
MNNLYSSKYVNPRLSSINPQLYSNIIKITRSRKNILTPSKITRIHNTKPPSKSKTTHSSTSTLSTFRKTSNLYNNTNHNSCTNITKNHAVNIKANTNANEINIHLSLNSDNANTQNNSSSTNIHNNSKYSINYYEDIIKEKEQSIRQLKNELHQIQKLLSTIKEQNNTNNIEHINQTHVRRRTINNELNLLIGNNKSSGNISSKAKASQNLMLFNLWDGRSKRCTSTNNGCNSIFFGLNEQRKRNWSYKQDRLKTFSAKTQRTFGKRKGSNTECNNNRKNSKNNNNKNVNVNDVHLMDNEELVCLCKMMIQRACKVFGMYNDIIRLNKIK